MIENFFYAVHQGKLTVIVEPDEDQSQHDLLEIDKESIKKWFDFLEESPVCMDESVEDVRRELREARTFWELSQEAPTTETQDKDLGHCQLWIRVGENLPSKVALIRRTGMLITKQQDGLIRFRGYQDFVALCVCEDPEGNELLRNMENPRHDKFEPERLPENERNKGRRALKRITKWIREEIRKVAGPPAGGQSTALEELAKFLPDLQPDDGFDDSNSDRESRGEPGFGQRVKVALKQVPQSAPKGLMTEEDSEDDGSDGDDTGNAGGSGVGGNSGEGGSGGKGDGDGEGGTGGRGGARVLSTPIPVSSVRVLPIDGQKNRYRLCFRADGDGDARLELHEAGDSSSVSRPDIRTVNDHESLERVHLQKGKRKEVIITAEMPIGDRALRLRAIRAKGD